MSTIVLASRQHIWPLRWRIADTHMVYGLTVMAIGAGCYLRASRILGGDFLLLDGGMFYTMAQDLVAAHFALPAFTSYNGGAIPFAYPPLSFYVTAAVAQLSPLSLVDAFRLVLLLANCLCLPVLWLLARSVMRSDWLAALATCAFALVPRSFGWLVTGGGLPRASGLLFALLALWQALRMYTQPRARHLAVVAIASSLCVLSHLETASFLAVSMVIFWLTWGRNRRGLVNSGVLALAVLLLTAPWWAAVLERHGLLTLLTALDSRTEDTMSISQYAIARSLRVLWPGFETSEPAMPLLAVLGVIGAVAAWRRGFRMLLPWWAAPIILMPAGRPNARYPCAVDVRCARAGEGCDTRFPGLAAGHFSPSCGNLRGDHSDLVSLLSVAIGTQYTFS